MLQKSSILKTLEIFFINPTRGYCLMDISKNINLAHTSVKKNLNQLIDSNLIIKTIEKKGKRNFPIYKANITNKSFKKQKILYNLSALTNSKLIEFIEDSLMPKSIVLFGSYRRGEDTASSDIDLFIQCKPSTLNLTKFEKILNRKIQLHFQEKFSNYPIELKNNIINGIVIHGFLEVYK